MTSRLVAHLGADLAPGYGAATLAAQIQALILDGRLTLGERLPSERALALELGRSRSTMTRAYAQLERDGFVSRLHGGSTRVTLPHREDPPPIAGVDGAIDLTIASMDSTPGLYDATVRALPRLAALRGTSGYSLQGMPELRALIADRFTERGAATSPEEIIVTSGALNAVNLVLTTIGRRGRTALVEQPTFPHALEALRRHGYRLSPTPVDAEGWDHTHLTDLLLRARPHAGYLIPDFHNPTGATMPDDMRERLAATARHAGTHLIIDETTTELDIDRPWAPRPMAAFGREVITVGSMSKIAWGGMRLGWIRAERSLIDALLAVRPSFELGTALLEQCIAIELLGDMPTLRSHVRDRLRAGRQAVTRGLHALPGVRMPETHGGLSTWLDLGEPVSTRLALTARDHGLILPPGPRFSTGGVLERRLRVPITLPPETTEAAMMRLSAAWDALHAGAVPAERELHHRAVI